jgi:peptidoglycan hydrolase CwlO-like protein
MIGPLNDLGSSNGSNSISFRWIANALVTLVFAVTLSFLGWIKTTVDRIDSRLDTIASDAYGLQFKLEALKDQITELKEQLTAGETQQEQLRKDVAELQLQEGIQADWIAAHFHADRAIRRLKEPAQ